MRDFTFWATARGFMSGSRPKASQKLLFLSRDGDILQKVYQKLYPEADTEYVYWSRAAATRLTAGYFRNEFFLRYIKYKISRKINMAQMLTAMELPQMQDFLTEKGFLPDTILTAENYEDIVSVFLQHWDVVESAYADSGKAARLYYAEKLQGGFLCRCGGCRLGRQRCLRF